ncbi:SDR family NAD(P)-dependent oxidoreductase [[Flexibacter] sp. ATCC 35208]|uniref:SDR family NAD(P)-dependent oxidoreductase n=1 Tax=[Flexibacter] sp. ATCC 35208 TaxID=1936242 RepID=UPI0009CC882A|nr:SDR family NAD(P)-dependent oxidoreductase [[Flexibacter] sp. ATCC 35208]OMP77699.1 short-chain dehydrogenase/reductase [[Flexibacter] sp. ATCC 35208]
MDNKKTWFVTGASKGLGLSLVKQLLAAGQSVAATSRNAAALAAAVGNDNSNFLPLEVDLSDDRSVASAIQSTVDKFGQIDVAVNNAGYGIGGSIEELSDAVTRTSFDINVFGTLNVIRHVLPFMRQKRSGHIINISSIAGITGNTGWSVYAATKYAITGLTDVLAQDVKEFGIHVTLVAPGAFRTSFLTAESLVMTDTPIADYTAIRNSHAKYAGMDGEQAGDPEKAAATMMQLVNMPEPPVYLLLGSDAYQRGLNKMEQLTAAFKATESLTKSTDY